MKRRDLLKAIFAAPLVAAVLPERLKQWEQEAWIKAECEEAWAAGLAEHLADTPFLIASDFGSASIVKMHEWQNDRLTAAVDVYVSEFGKTAVGRLHDLYLWNRKQGLGG